MKQGGHICSLQNLRSKESCWTLDVSRTASYEITLVCLSVHLSVRPSLNFVKIGLLVFAGILHGDSWSWYLMTDKARFLKKKKKKWQPEFGPNGNKSGPKWASLPFSWVLIIIFPWNCIRKVLATILTSSRGKIHEKIFGGPNLG